MNQNITAASRVAEAAVAIQKRGKAPSIRGVIAELGAGSPNHIGPLLKAWKDSQLPMQVAPIEVDVAVIEAIGRQLIRSAADATANAQAKAEVAEDNAALLASSCSNLEVLLHEKQAELEAAVGRARQQEGQLGERQRELEELRNTSAADIADARAIAASERATAEDLRQQLVRATLRLEALPHLEKVLEEREQALSTAISDIARARQGEAVAVAQLQAQQERALEAGQRESEVRKQASKQEADMARAWDVERALRIEVQQHAGQAAVALSRCATLEVQLKPFLEHLGRRGGHAIVVD